MSTLRIDYIGRLSPLAGGLTEEEVEVSGIPSAADFLELVFQLHPDLGDYCYGADGRPKRSIAVLLRRPQYRAVTIPLPQTERLRTETLADGSRIVLM